MKKIALAATAAAMLVLSGCSVTGGGGATAPSAKDKSPIQVGVILPQSGPYTILGAPQTAALKLEVDKVNEAGGVNGRQIKLTFRDDTSDPTVSVQLYNELAETGKYDAMISSSRTANSQAVGPSALQYEIPTLALGPVNAFADGSNPWDFVIPTTGAVNAEAQIKYFKDEGLKKVAIAFIDGDAYGQDGQDSLAKFGPKYGISTVFSQGFDPATTDFTPLIQNVLASGADAFWVWGSGPTPSIITAQWAAAAANSKTQLFMTASQASNLYSYKDGKPVASTNGVHLSSNIAVVGPQLPDSDLKTMVADFAKRWSTLGNDQYSYPPQFAFEAAKAIQVLSAGVKAAGSTDHKKLRDAIEGLDILTYTGQTKYSAKDHVGLTPDWIAIDSIKDGNFLATDYSVAKFKELLK
ncbi:ABC transporter substrate-binding protein [Parafrigoribacterium soli]|uniref:ABC transporter substrate-binding protein n=1 Tax=Parafrigoribacterium soli TaxID=3144663 RepID=UPI0032EE7582